MTTDFESVDYFTDPSLVPDPHPYFDHIRSKDATCCPISNGVLAVTGWESANAVYKDTENYSSRVPSLRSRSPRRATTSAHSSRSTARRSRCTSTWSRWTSRTTPMRGHC
jgi:hypothetical protein